VLPPGEFNGIIPTQSFVKIAVTVWSKVGWFTHRVTKYTSKVTNTDNQKNDISQADTGAGAR